MPPTRIILNTRRLLPSVMISRTLLHQRLWISSHILTTMGNKRPLLEVIFMI